MIFSGCSEDFVSVFFVPILPLPSPSFFVYAGGLVFVLYFEAFFFPQMFMVLKFALPFKHETRKADWEPQVFGGASQLVGFLGEDRW